jgi:hypothetical protein
MISLLPRRAQQATVHRFKCASLDIPQPVTVNGLIPDVIYSKAQRFFIFCHFLCALLPTAQNCANSHIPGLCKGSSAALPSTVCVPNRLPEMACAHRPNNKRGAGAAPHVTARTASWPGRDDGCGRNVKRRLSVVAPLGRHAKVGLLLSHSVPVASGRPRRRGDAARQT